MAGKIKIVFSDFQRANSELKAISDQIDGFKSELSGQYGAMRAQWRGQAGDAFEECYQKTLVKFDDNIAAIRQLCTDISKVGQAMQQADEQLARDIAQTAVAE